MSEAVAGGSRRVTRRDRVRLLLQSYPDVIDLPQSHDGGPASGPSSRLLSRSVNPLWSAGSYPALERCLAKLKARSPSVCWHTVEFWVRGDPSGKARRRKANLGLDALVRWMPRNVYVPQSVSERDGVNTAEARAAERPRRRLHAA